MPESDPRARKEIDQRVREAIYAHFIAHGLPPELRALAKGTSIPLDDAEEAVRRIAHPSDVVLAPGSTEIWMAHPFCAPGTGYRVRCNGQQYWVGCGWDAVGIAAVLDSDVDVLAPCPDCGESLSIGVRGGRSDDEAIIHVLVPPASSFRNIAFTCGTTLLFRAEEHARRWCEQRHVEFGGLMTLNQGIELYRMLSTNRLSGHWEPPPLEARLDAFRSVGLAGEFWMTRETTPDQAPAAATLADLRDNHRLTDRELQVLALLASAMSVKQIAHRLELSRHTVDTHVRNIYAKLRVTSRAAAVAVALRARIL